jgi:hypothetical protein
MNFQNQNQRVPLTLAEVEALKRKKKLQYGTKLYKYPGDLADDDPEHNAADNEDNLSAN